MTDEELKAYEERHGDAWRMKRINVGDSTAWQALVAEVRRLKGLVKDREFSCYVGNSPTHDSGAGYECYWCGASPGDRHTERCDVFTPNGDVR